MGRPWKISHTASPPPPQALGSGLGQSTGVRTRDDAHTREFLVSRPAWFPHDPTCHGALLSPRRSIANVLPSSPTDPPLVTVAPPSSRSISSGHDEPSASVKTVTPSPSGPRSSRRRRSSAAGTTRPPAEGAAGAAAGAGATGAAAAGSSHLAPIPDRNERNSPVSDSGEFGQTMSLSRSPSPIPGGGWASPGLMDQGASGRSSPRKGYGDLTSGGSLTGGSSVTWASAKARSQAVNGYASFSTKNSGFFSRHARTISASLPQFRSMSGKRDFGEKEKLQRGRWAPYVASGRLGQLQTFLGSLTRRMKTRVLVVLGVVLLALLFWVTPLHRVYRRASFLGGGSKFVIVLEANIGGGVMDWKGPREWAIERDSVRNKKRYAKKWGYDLEIVDMVTKKRYAHEWRESWEKVDSMRNCMRKYPKAEWFWWLDLHTFIMEPSYSLQSQIFNQIESNTYRDINEYNPLNLTHPFREDYLDPLSISTRGDGRPNSVDLIVPQDCAGFNLGSFFMRRSPWTDRLLDLWWDPVLYEQKHMDWEHKEQDALEHLYTTQPWVRTHTAFIEQRKINSFPPGACGEAGNNTRVHYDQKDRDFVVNMAGCQWGRDCWGEMYNYRELSNYLNRTPWEKFKDGVRDAWKGVFGKK